MQCNLQYKAYSVAYISINVLPTVPQTTNPGVMKYIQKIYAQYFYACTANTHTHAHT